MILGVGRKPSTSILVVDDDEMIRTIVATMLQKAGYNVVEASSGHEGIRLFREHGDAISLIISDALMPGMSGPEMLDRIAKIQPSVPILLITGVSEAMLPDCYRGRYALLYKPFTIETLLEAARKQLSNRS